MEIHTAGRRFSDLVCFSSSVSEIQNKHQLGGLFFFMFLLRYAYVRVRDAYFVHMAGH
jgi:hypothetical protein